MKKLLVILLLLFPVHGAWAENISYLTCTFFKPAKELTVHFIIDYDNNIVTNSHGVPYKNSRINEQIIQFQGPDKGRKQDIKEAFFSIDRRTGRIETTWYWTDGKSGDQSGQCEKTTGTKKKF